MPFGTEVVAIILALSLHEFLSEAMRKLTPKGALVLGALASVLGVLIVMFKV